MNKKHFKVTLTIYFIDLPLYVYPTRNIKRPRAGCVFLETMFEALLAHDNQHLRDSTTTLLNSTEHELFY